MEPEIQLQQLQATTLSAKNHGHFGGFTLPLIVIVNTRLLIAIGSFAIVVNAFVIGVVVAHRKWRQNVTNALMCNQLAIDLVAGAVLIGMINFQMRMPFDYGAVSHAVGTIL